MITQERLKEVLSYNPDTGDFTWKIKTGKKVIIGRVAGCVKGGYVHIRIDGESYKAHRLAFLYMTGKIPDIVDHANGVPSDNRWENIREATQSQNMMNRRIGANNTSGIKGVHWDKRKKKWMARIWIEKKSTFLGYFPDLISAELTVRDAQKRHYGEYYKHS